jgi:hypothetical protein
MRLDTTEWDQEIKYKLAKFVPMRFRNAVLDKFLVFRDEERLVLRLSYYHLKKKTTLNYQQVLTNMELAHPISGDLAMYSAIGRMVFELKQEGQRKP